MIEKKLITQFPCEVIAVDEVGRAPLAGGVVVGGVRVYLADAIALQTLLKFLKPKGVTDSKKLCHLSRQKILSQLKVPELGFRIKGEFDVKGIKVDFITWDMCHETVDKINILAASLEAMRQSALNLSEKKNDPTYVLIDGHLKLRWPNGISPWNEIPIIKGDSKSLLIGLASIIAKERRDGFMKEMHEIYPHYGFNTNAGYPTPKHKKAIQEFGPCPIHRKTFAGVKEHLGAS
jgi:ribonuclease HII